MVGLFKPAGLGAFVSVRDETALMTVDVSSLTLGTFAFVTSEGLYFQLVVNGSNDLIWQQVAFGGVVHTASPVSGDGSSGNPITVIGIGQTRSVTTSSPATTLSIDVSADGDGLYEIEFEGFIDGTAGIKTLKLQPNGADFPSNIGNYKTYNSAGVLATGGFTAGVCLGQNFVTHNQMSVSGRFSWRANVQGCWASDFASYSDSANFTGETVGTYIASASPLSTIALTGSAAGAIVSGTFYVRKIMS